MLYTFQRSKTRQNYVNLLLVNGETLGLKGILMLSYRNAIGGGRG